MQKERQKKVKKYENSNKALMEIHKRSRRSVIINKYKHRWNDIYIRDIGIRIENDGYLRMREDEVLYLNFSNYGMVSLCSRDPFPVHIITYSPLKNKNENMLKFYNEFEIMGSYKAKEVIELLQKYKRSRWNEENNNA